MTVPELLEFSDKVHDSARHLLRRAQSRIKTRGVSRTEQIMREVEQLMVIRNRLETIFTEPVPIHSSNTESMRLRNDMFTRERQATTELIDALFLLFRHNLDPVFINSIRSILNSYNRSSSMLSRQPPNENIRASLPQGAPVLTRQQPRIDLFVNIGGTRRKYRKNTSYKLSKCKYGQCHKKKTRRNNVRR